MIDENGYRANVGIILANGIGQVLWARRIGHDAWQFPQGGMQLGETPEQAMYRELDEEIGLPPEAVNIIDCTRGWLRYKLPSTLIRHGKTPLCIGQKQKWFLLEYHAGAAEITLDHHPTPEFDRYQWVNYWYPLEHVVSFKRSVYQRALKELVTPHNRLIERSLC